MYDTINLRYDIKFETLVFPNVFWVPYNSLGKTKFSNENIKNLLTNEIEFNKIKHEVSTPYEIAQLIQINNFTMRNDIYTEYKYGIKWDMFVTGTDLLHKKSGGCATYASLFNTLLNDKYTDVYMLCILANSSGGHVINYIIHNKFYYFFDLSSQLNEYIKDIPIETGLKRDFVKLKIPTGACYKADSINSFIKFFEKYNIYKKLKFSYYKVKAEVVPPISYYYKNNILMVKLRKEDKCEIMEDYSDGSIIYDLI